MASAVEELRLGIAAVEQELLDLAGYLAPLEASWAGASAQSYLDCRRRWDEAAGELQQSLVTLRSIVSGAHANYTAADAANAAMWGA